VRRIEGAAEQTDFHAGGVGRKAGHQAREDGFTA